MKTTKLYRPVGIKELLLIQEMDFEGFPPRLEWQPIFYPVLNKAYADSIANDWNTKDEFSGYAGFVLSFKVDMDYLNQFPVKNVGAKNHDELWIPSKELESFNQNIQGKIKVEDAFFGEKFDDFDSALIIELHQKFK